MLPGYSVWIEIQANKATISDARKFRTAMQHCAEAGVDAVLLSVRDTSGYVLYPSTLAPSYSEYDPTFAPGVDYLRQCLEICRQEGIALYAAMDVFVAATETTPGRRCRHYGTRTGRRKCMGLDAAGKPCVCPVLQAGSLQTVSSIDDFGELFLDPMNPEVQQYLLDIAGEVLSRYPVQGLVLDRARYVGLCSDFGPLTRQAVEQLAGTAAGWPASGLPDSGRQGGAGTAFRCFPHQPGQGNPRVYGADASCVHRFPGVCCWDYTGSWYPLYDQVGANWALPGICRRNTVWHGRNSISRRATHRWWIICSPAAITRNHRAGGTGQTRLLVQRGREPARLARQVVMGDTPVTAGLFLDQYRDAPARIAQAIQMCFAQTGRCMLFDLSYRKGWLVAICTALYRFAAADRRGIACLHTLLQKALPQSYDLGRNVWSGRPFTITPYCRRPPSA